MKVFVAVAVQFAALVATCVANPGQCPANDGSVGICVEGCVSDSDCLGHQRCCPNGCGRTCLDTQRARTGHKPRLQCPAPVDASLGVCREACVADGECAAGELCCSTNDCGHACVAAVGPPEKPGRCPGEGEGRADSAGACTDECGLDGDCEDDLKCCGTGCGYVCTEPVRDTNATKSGSCPETPLEGLGICSESCSADVDCPGDLKCCSNGCGHVCANPSRATKPGACPAVTSGQAGVCSEDCDSDVECPGQQRCCSNGCGHSCTDTTAARPTKPGRCPAVPEGAGGICSEECSADGDCEGDGKCCRNGCGHGCMDPVETASLGPSGQCPAVLDTDGLGICSEECSSDSDCVGGAQKCCSNGCGHVCMDTTTPVTTHGMSCRLGESSYRHGELVPTDGDCETCLCKGGEVVCMVRDPCKQGGLFTKALAIPIILSIAGILLSLVLITMIIRCFMIRESSQRSRYKLMHEVPEFEAIPRASSGMVL